MTLRVTNYATLAVAVQAYMKRSNIGIVDGNLDYLCGEAEEEMNARLRVRRMLTTVTPTVNATTGVVTLPADFAGWKRFTVRDGSAEWDLDLVSAEETTNVTQIYSAGGVPRALILTGATAQVYPFLASLYTFVGVYFATIPQLTSAAPTNWIITKYPNAYLYGCLAAARGLVSDDQPVGGSRFDMWAKMFSRAVNRIAADDARDFDARDNATLESSTTLFGGTVRHDIEADG